MKNKKGISLIVLVITIIVLAILAATVIVTITNSGIINKATDTVKIHDLSQVRSLANLAWSEALMDETITTDAEYDAYVKQQLTNAGVNVSDYDISASINGIEVNKKSDTVWEANVTAATPNVIFTKADGVTPGDPENLEDGDIVLYGDYEYRYNMHKSSDFCDSSPFYGDDDYTQYDDYDGDWENNSSLNGWGVILKESCLTKTEVGKICNSLFGKNVVSANATFVEASIIKAPELPDSIIYLDNAFWNCKSLVEVPKLPLTHYGDMCATFYGCTSLKIVPAMPEGPTHMFDVFRRMY